MFSWALPKVQALIPLQATYASLKFFICKLGSFMAENEKSWSDRPRNGAILYLEGAISWNICGEIFIIHVLSILQSIKETLWKAQEHSCWSASWWTPHCRGNVLGVARGKQVPCWPLGHCNGDGLPLMFLLLEGEWSQALAVGMYCSGSSPWFPEQTCLTLRHGPQKGDQ